MTVVAAALTDKFFESEFFEEPFDELQKIDGLEAVQRVEIPPMMGPHELPRSFVVSRTCEIRCMGFHDDDGDSRIPVCEIALGNDAPKT